MIIWETYHNEMLYLMLVKLPRKSNLLFLKIGKFLVLCTTVQSHMISGCVNGKQRLLLFHLFFSGSEGFGKLHFAEIIFYSVNKGLM